MISQAVPAIAEQEADKRLKDLLQISYPTRTEGYAGFFTGQAIKTALSDSA